MTDSVHWRFTVEEESVSLVAELETPLRAAPLSVTAPVGRTPPHSMILTREEQYPGWQQKSRGYGS